MSITDAMKVLPMNKSKCRQTYLQDNGNRYDKIVIGAIILKWNPGMSPEILLLKRAVHEKIYPNIWEIPGGKVEESDPNIFDAIKREVLEETSLKIDKVIGTIGSFDYAVERKIATKDRGMMSIWSQSLQLNYICEVAGHDFVVDPEEHSEGRFVAQSGLKALEMTEQMRKVVEEAFAWCAQVSMESKGTEEEVMSDIMGP